MSISRGCRNSELINCDYHVPLVDSGYPSPATSASGVNFMNDKSMGSRHRSDISRLSIIIFGASRKSRTADGN